MDPSQVGFESKKLDCLTNYMPLKHMNNPNVMQPPFQVIFGGPEETFSRIPAIRIRLVPGDIFHKGFPSKSATYPFINKVNSFLL